MSHAFDPPCTVHSSQFAPELDEGKEQGRSGIMPFPWPGYRWLLSHCPLGGKQLPCCQLNWGAGTQGAGTHLSSQKPHKWAKKQCWMQLRLIPQLNHQRKERPEHWAKWCLTPRNSRMPGVCSLELRQWGSCYTAARTVLLSFSQKYFLRFLTISFAYRVITSFVDYNICNKIRKSNYFLFATFLIIN